MLSVPHAGRSQADGDALQELLTKRVLPMLVFRSDDVDATFKKVRASGAEVLQEPVDQAWDPRDCAFRRVTPSAWRRPPGLIQATVTHLANNHLIKRPFGGCLVFMAASSRSLGHMRALAHPLRLRMLSLLTGGPSSAAEVARELGVSQANASYHLRQLLGAGLIDDAGELAVRGGRARMYRHLPDPGASVHEEGTPPSVEGTAAVVEALIAELRRRYAMADHSVRGNLTDAELWVDPEVWAQTVTAVTDASHALHAAARPPRTDGTIPVNMTSALFAMRTSPPDSAHPEPHSDTP